MRNSDDIWKIIEKHLSAPLEDLWGELTPEERMQVFIRLIIEYLQANY